MGKKTRRVKEKERLQKKELFDETNFIYMRIYNLMGNMEEQGLISSLERARLFKMFVYNIRLLQNHIHEDRSHKGIKKNKVIKILKAIKESLFYIYLIIKGEGL